MKKNLLLIIALVFVAVTSAQAKISVEECTDAEFLLNSGYSSLSAEDIFVSKNRANGKPIEPLYETSNNIFVKAWKKLYAYVDPGQDLPDRIHHDIKPAPHYTDL